MHARPIMLAAMMALSAGGLAQEPPAAPPVKAKPDKTAFSGTVSSFNLMFKRDAHGAVAKKFVGRVVTVRGTVKGVAAADGGGQTLTLEGMAPTDTDPAGCTIPFSAKHPSLKIVAGLTAGMVVQVRGTIDGVTGVAFTVKDPVLVSAGPAVKAPVAATGPEKTTKESPDRLAAVKKEYTKRGAKSHVYENEGKTWVAFDFPDATTDAELVGLPEPPLPCHFNLHLCRITDAGVKELKRISTLRSLDLSSSRITDASMKELGDMKGLMYLRLAGIKVSDAGLKDLKRLDDLVDLDLFITPVTDAGVKELLGFKKLSAVNLRETQVTSVGLKVLKGHKTLKTLRIGGPAVTDAWIEDMKALDNVEILVIDDSKITDQGLATLRKALPRCLISK